MTIYIDEIRDYPKNGLWCHLWTDGSDEALDAFAISIGLKKEWSHTSHGITGRFYHYDLSPPKRLEALKKGAIFLPLRDWIKSKLAIGDIDTNTKLKGSPIDGMFPDILKGSPDDDKE